ncbi:hypothetical protein Sjap_004170 [Stephania japonica]|uniref:Box C/D snoRNA protein 1 n=1 Tax=Stephania japonica TaxID=461633 RepID=A0AAP0K1T0_9MAGN
MEADKIASSDKSLLCEECNLNPWKYKCPGCSIRSCSLPCVKSHKNRTSCTGKRPRTEVVPISQFNDNLLISDYNFLEEAKRIAESAERMRNAVLGKPYFKLPYNLRALKTAAAHQKIVLLFLPSGMSKRKQNQTRYNPKTKSILWMVEWRFHSTGVVLVDKCVDENMTLSAVIEKHLNQGPWNNQLRPFCDERLESLRFFIRKSARGAKSAFVELDVKAPISQQLAGTTIVEYPVIHVYLPSANCDFEVIKAVKSLTQESQLKEPGDNDLPSPTGVPFREEEIEDDITENPQILDVMKYRDPRCLDNTPVNNAATSSLRGIRAGTNEAAHVANSMKFGVGETNNFYFEQDLRDAYSSLIGEADPDNYFDFEGACFEGVIEDEELEEGEIRGC